METKQPESHGILFVRFRDEGDMAAMEAIMNHYYRPLFTYLMRMLKSREDAEDSLQEVWLKVIHQRKTYKDQGQFSSWLYRIAHNYCLDLYRKRNRRPFLAQETECEDGTGLLDLLPSAEQTPFEIAVDNENMIRLEELVDQLPEPIREVYLLRSVHEIPFKEIAEIQECPIGTVLSRMHQAVKRLQQGMTASQPAHESA